jgi:hypothetical protein
MHNHAQYKIKHHHGLDEIKPKLINRTLKAPHPIGLPAPNGGRRDWKGK